ncbi:MAG: 3-dehydroquinate synthase, partial [Proteobacteria bacterium]|nr:3-dehydroquinate synthase [Pseudomonadota bacterium]
LNFGHTIGHAVETLNQTKQTQEKMGLAGHGRAISLGMVAAAMFSQRKKLISPDEVDRITSLLRGLNLPVDLDYRADQIIAAASRDKKKQGSSLHYVFLEAIGTARVEKIPYDEMNDFIRSVFTGS